MSKLIHDWNELSSIPNESATHILEIDTAMCNGWLKAKEKKPYRRKLSFMRTIRYRDIYLSTHTFYGSSYKFYTKVLKACGFDVELDNWDKEGE